MAGGRTTFWIPVLHAAEAANAAAGKPARIIAKMNSLVERVRNMLGEVGAKRGRRLVLAIRVPSNYGRMPPTPETAVKQAAPSMVSRMNRR